MKARISTLPLLVCLVSPFSLMGGPVPEAPDRVIEDIEQRLVDLIADSDAAQYKTVGSLPDDRSFTVGEYPALVDFLVGSPGDLQPVIEDVPDASGSSFIGLWFLSQAHRILGQIDLFDTAPLRQAIRVQIERADLLPQFFQGTSEDVWECPPETMGWYPLIDGYRLPSLLPDRLEALLPGSVKKDLANLSDGDIWAWSMAIDDTTPGILQYHHPITSADIYAPLLGSRQDWDSIDPQSRLLYRQVWGPPTNSRFPIGTFYCTSDQSQQRFSGVVMANILSSIPLLAEVSDVYATDIDNAVSFVRDAARLALRQEQSWQQFAYDYYTIPVAPIAYVARAHKRIIEIGRAAYPRLLDDDTIAEAVRYITQQTEQKLANPNLYTEAGAQDYASLVYCFSAMVNLRHTDPTLFDKDLLDRTMNALLVSNPASYTVPGTGPYSIAGQIWADMASICFVVPPLIEAFALYLQIEV
ncbi:MAG: hypothetical protein ACE5JX_09155 [Acidobacteriota bacterium]